MFKKTIFTAVAAAALATTVFAPAAIAGGHSNHHGRDYQHPWAIGVRDAVVTRHIDWCFRQHNSYRTSDNTYWTGQGARLQCSSPFMKR
ncbi:BA14K family protein [Stappia sp. BW2]|uniref:BA14K family protein n=1 Tax=Stappia sp. BW2 TaxID=2592622 RepID=UPI0011DEB840|nr:BA14K family protein [Stappia sp. BW2]TYC67875.1 BA14K family protein [Stappia sp. BW2]